MKRISLFQLRALHIAAVVTCALALAQSLNAQEALRSAVEGDRAYRERSSPDYLPGTDRLHAGPVEFQASITYGLEWNDNVFLRSANEEDDLIHRPQANLRALWQVTDKSRLGFGVGIGYEIYTDHSELGGLLITPNSEFAWDILVEDFAVTVYDRCNYSQDVMSQGTIGGGTAEFPRLENTAGFRVRWNPSRYVFELGYGHQNFITMSGGSTNFDYLDRSAEQFFGRAGIQLAQATTTGIEASAGFTDYESSVQSDNTSISVGPFMDWQATESLNLSLRGGMVLYSFDSSSSRPASDDLNSFYLGLEAQHQLTDHIRHGISLRRDVQQGLNQGSDYIEQFYSRYFMNWQFHRIATLATDVFYEISQEPRSGVTGEYNRFGTSLGLTLQPVERLQTGIGFRYTSRNSDLPDSDYLQNLLFLNLSYRF